MGKLQYDQVRPWVAQKRVYLDSLKITEDQIRLMLWHHCKWEVLNFLEEFSANTSTKGVLAALLKHFQPSEASLLHTLLGIKQKPREYLILFEEVSSGGCGY